MANTWTVEKGVYRIEVGTGGDRHGLSIYYRLK